jgi:hypothetical protein
MTQIPLCQDFHDVIDFVWNVFARGPFPASIKLTFSTAYDKNVSLAHFKELE